MLESAEMVEVKGGSVLESAEMVKVEGGSVLESAEVVEVEGEIVVGDKDSCVTDEPAMRRISISAHTLRTTDNHKETQVF